MSAAEDGNYVRGNEAMHVIYLASEIRPMPLNALMRIFFGTDIL
jgi:hypothetical protein